LKSCNERGLGGDMVLDTVGSIKSKGEDKADMVKK